MRRKEKGISEDFLNFALKIQPINKKEMKRILQTFICAAVVTTASAQLSTNPDKFLGNITTRYQMDAGGGVPQFYKLWNQVTCENESKWGSVEGTRNSYNWGCDNAFD